jgi:hypothetical protein
VVTPVGYPYETQEPPTQTGPCEADFPVGTVVTLTATPDPGNNAQGGMDCGSGYSNPCHKTMVSGYNAVTAMFCPDNGLCSAG